jgi:four helix bundle protein
MLIAYQVSLDLIRQLRPIVDDIKKHNSHLADQIVRAASNTALNLAEGQRRVGGHKRNSFQYAHGEANEIVGCLDTAMAWGWADNAIDARATLDRLLALCWRLTHSRTGEPHA